MGHVRTQLVTITPARAKAMLSKNTMNRAVKQQIVERYASDMSLGLWDTNGETIKIADDGTILDGQHRLLACIKADTPFSTIVTTGLDVSAIYTIDCGSARKTNDSLKIDGVKNYRTVATISTAFIMVLENDSLEPYFARNGRYVKPSITRVVGYYYNNSEEVDKIAERAKRAARNGIISEPMAALIHSAGSSVSEDDADYFIDRINSGEGLSAGDPILETRNALIKDKMSHTKRMPIRVKNALVIKAWNKFICGESVSKMSFRQGGAHRERFPEMIGYDFQKIDYRSALPSNGL